MQPAPLLFAIEQFLATPPYYPCYILAHPEIGRLRQATELLRERYHWPMFSIGEHLSAALLTVAPRQRARMIAPTLTRAITSFNTGPLLCSDIDVLFEPALECDPLRILRDASKSAPLIVLWPGVASPGMLAYAVPEHAHYRSWKPGDGDLSATQVLSL